LFLPIVAVALLLLALPAFATEVADQQSDPDTLGEESEPLKIFILAGQSNMQGYGIISAGKEGDLDYAAANDFKYFKDKDGDWVERRDVWYFERDGNRVCNLKINLGASGPRFGPKIGPELAFGHVLGDHFDEQVLLIKCAWGGQALAGPWRSPSAGPNPADPDGEYTGKRYREMLEIVRDVTSNLKKYYPDYKGQGYEIAGLFWHQGWNDGCNKAFTAEYEKNMIHFVADVRKDLGVEDLPFIIATSGMGGKGGAVVVPQLKAAQQIDNCYAVDTIRFRGARVNKQISHWFNNATSYCEIGSFSAKAMIAALRGEAPAAEIVGHVDPDTPNPAARPVKK
jgi:alpha-galactosidase